MRKIRIVALGLAALSMCPAVSQAGDGLVALQTADPSCPDSSDNIYLDCGNGTVTDNRTGLVWLKNANCYGTTSWTDAMLTAAGLSSGHCGLTDGSSPGEWRLPSKEEWEAMVEDVGGLNCSPFLTNDDATQCWADDPGGSSFIGLTTGFYLASTTSMNFAPTSVWFINMTNGFIGDGEGKMGDDHFWPVRGGQ